MKKKQKVLICIGLSAVGLVALLNLSTKTTDQTSSQIASDGITAEDSFLMGSEFADADAEKGQEDSVHTRIRYEKDLIYDMNNRDTCRMDVAIKRDGTKKPLLICVHGGYYSSGSKKDMKKYLAEFSADGYVAASIDYPLLPDGTIVKQIESVIKAVDYFAEHADIYEIDIDRISLLGFSSGAHIAVCAAEKIAVREAGIPTLAAIIDISGPTDYRYLIDKYGGADSTSPAIIDGNAEADLSEELKKVDCTDNITKNLPRTMIIHGRRDETVPCEVSERFYNSLKTAGVAAELKTIESMGHVTDMKTVIPLVKLFLEG